MTFITGKKVFLIAAIGLTIYAGSKSQVVFYFDAYLADTGSYATNAIVHVAAVARDQSLPLTNCDILVYAQEKSGGVWINLGNPDGYSRYARLSDLPCDWTWANATNFNYRILVDYVPPSPVHTNGVWQMRGIPIPPDVASEKFAFPNTTIRKE